MRCALSSLEQVLRRGNFFKGNVFVTMGMVGLGTVEPGSKSEPADQCIAKIENQMGVRISIGLRARV